MIYVTGDCHRNFERFTTKNFPEQKRMTKSDYVIICGDFGGIWDKDTESKEEASWLEWLEEKPFTTLFVDGNHENFDRLYTYPVEEWNGGKIHKIRNSVFHLMRGQIFEIYQKKIFTFGGARCHDISDGILEIDDPAYKQKRKRLEKEGAFYRVNHLSWWKEELPSEEEMQEGRRNLALHDNEVDFIVTHCCSTSTQRFLGYPSYETDYLTEYLEELKQKVKYKFWFFGHYHDEKNVNEKEKLLYRQLVRIG